MEISVYETRPVQVHHRATVLRRITLAEGGECDLDIRCRLAVWAGGGAGGRQGRTVADER